MLRAIANRADVNGTSEVESEHACTPLMQAVKVTNPRPPQIPDPQSPIPKPQHPALCTPHPTPSRLSCVTSLANL